MIPQDRGQLTKTQRRLLALLAKTQGTEVSALQMAKKLKVSKRTVERSLRTLRETGLLKVEDHGCRPSTYQVVTQQPTSTADSGLARGQIAPPFVPPNGGTDSLRVRTDTTDSYRQEVVVVNKEEDNILCTRNDFPAEPSAPPDPPKPPTPRSGKSSTRKAAPATPWPPPPPAASGQPIGLFAPEIAAFADYFEALAAPHLKRVHPGRCERAVDEARQMLVFDRRPLPELVALTAWVFVEHGGVFPFTPVFNGRARRRKVTGLDQLRRAYTKAVERMGDERRGVRHLAEDPPVHTAEQIDELVACFAEFRSRSLDGERGDFARKSWSRTFEIMLDRDHHSFADVRRVLTSLSADRLEGFGRYIDVSRLSTPFLLRSEFDQVLQDVDDLEAAFARHPDHPHAPGRSRRPVKQQFDDDVDDVDDVGVGDGAMSSEVAALLADFPVKVPGRRSPASQPRAVSVDMSSNVADRRARYALRAAG